MKTIKSYISESIFDIDDETIVNKKSSDLFVFRNNEVADKFNKIKPIDKDELNEIIKYIGSRVDGFDKYVYEISNVDITTSQHKWLEMYIFDEIKKIYVASFEFTISWTSIYYNPKGREIKIESIYSDLTKKQKVQLTRTLHNIR